MFDRLTNPFAVDSAVCALGWLAFGVRPPYVFSFRPDSAVPGREFHDPIDVLHVLHAPSEIVVHTIVDCLNTIISSVECMPKRKQ